MSDFNLQSADARLERLERRLDEILEVLRPLGQPRVPCLEACRMGWFSRLLRRFW